MIILFYFYFRHVFIIGKSEKYKEMIEKEAEINHDLLLVRY